MFEFKRIKEENIEQILRWRTDPDIDKWMFTHMTYDLEKHLKWIGKIDLKQYWVIYFQDRAIGLINLEKDNGYGFYIGEKGFWGLAGLVLPHFYNYVFSKTEREKIVATVLCGNPIVAIHKMHGFELLDLVYGPEQSFQILELAKAKWLSDDRFKHYVTEFE